ncbi:MAG TPA: MCE family protein [Acidimicrobiales bacterium]|nr:MCE family protein [Acidimicrobiales bacterium]
MIRTAIKFGMFVLVCLSFTVYLAFTIGNISISDPLARDYNTYHATFDDVTGLLPDDNVKIAGVVVGKVKKIGVTDGKALVSFTVKKSVTLGPKTSASIRWRNLIGQRYVYVSPDPNTHAVTKLVDGEITSTTSTVDLGELFNRLGPIVTSLDSKQINDFLDTVSQALDGNQDKVGKAIDDLATLSKGLATRDQSISRLVENLNTVAGTIANRDQQIRVMLDNLVLISSTFSANTQTLDTALQEFGTFSTNLRTILTNNSDQIDRIINNLDVLSTDVVAPKLGELDHALKGIDEASKHIFLSARLGEWLNEAILCAATGPPPPGPVGCSTPIVKQVDPTQGNIGSRAPTTSSGANTLENFLIGSLR